MKGFTLIELMITIAILGILAGISIGVGPGIIHSAKVRAELRGFLSDCRKAQMHAGFISFLSLVSVLFWQEN